MGPVYSFPGHPPNTISSGALKLYVGFQKVMSEPLQHCDFVDPQGRSWRSLYHTQKNLEYLKIAIFKVNPHRYNNIVFPTVFAISKQNLLQLIRQCFVHISITITKKMTRRELMEGIP